MFSYKPKTVNDVLSSFTKLLTDLETVATQHAANIDTHTKVIEFSQANIAASQVEAERAATVKARIEALLSV